MSYVQGGRGDVCYSHIIIGFVLEGNAKGVGIEGVLFLLALGAFRGQDVLDIEGTGCGNCSSKYSSWRKSFCVMLSY